MLRRTPLIAFLGLLMLPALAASQQGPDADARIQAAYERAAAAGLPVALLESKVAEGRAKGVAPERIALAVERRLLSLTRARESLRRVPNVTSSHLAVGADALEAGVSEAALGALAAETQAERRTVAIAVLTQLVQLGEPPTSALQRVRAALQRGPEALQQLPAEAAGSQPRGGGGGRPASAGQQGQQQGQQQGRGQQGQGRGPPAAGAPRGGPPAAAPAGGKGPGAGKPGRSDPPGKGQGRGPPRPPPGRNP